MSQFKSFFIRAVSDEQICDDLNYFLRSHKIIRLKEGFVTGENPGFHILVEYAENAEVQNKQSKRVDYRAMLNTESEKTMFDALKKFRSELCKKDKLVGAYMICKDEHLFAMVQNPHMTSGEIAALPHSANIKIEQYSDALAQELLKFSTKAVESENEDGKIPF